MISASLFTACVFNVFSINSCFFKLSVASSISLLLSLDFPSSGIALTKITTSLKLWVRTKQFKNLLAEICHFNTQNYKRAGFHMWIPTQRRSKIPCGFCGRSLMCKCSVLKAEPWIPEEGLRSWHLTHKSQLRRFLVMKISTYAQTPACLKFNLASSRILSTGSWLQACQFT